MPQFQFSLEPLLRLRTSERDQRRMELAAAQREHDGVLSQRDDLRHALETAQAQRRKLLAAAPLDVPSLQSCHRYEATLRKQAARLQAELSEAAAKVERCRDALAVADREVRQLEKLRQRRYDEWKVALVSDHDFGDK